MSETKHDAVPLTREQFDELNSLFKQTHDKCKALGVPYIFLAFVGNEKFFKDSDVSTIPCRVDVEGSKQSIGHLVKILSDSLSVISNTGFKEMLLKHFS